MRHGFGECFCLEEMKQIAEWAKDELLDQLESQIYGDGSHLGAVHDVPH